MSACILSSKTVFSSNLKRASPRRRFCPASSASPPQTLEFHIQKLGKSLIPNVVVLESHFSGPNSNRDIHHCPRTGTGFFINPTLIVTSTRVVGHVSLSYDSRPAPPSDKFPLDSILYKAYIARTAAFTPEGVMLDTRPVAVNFARDVAVLEVVQPAPPPPRGCVLAEAPPEKDSFLLAISRHQSLGLALMLGNARVAAGGERTIIRAKAPWPLDDELGWVEHGWLGIGISDPAPGSSGLTNASATRIVGSPWFNLAGEVVGVSSWQVTDKADEFSVGFAAPPSSIRAVVDYVKTKGGDDPVVMDRWIADHVGYEDS